MKKLIAILFAGLLLITSMSVAVWADDDEDFDDKPIDGADPGPRFYSISELIEYRNYLRLIKVDNGYPAGYQESYECIDYLEGLYLPEGLTFDDITEFMAGTYFYYVYFEIDGITLEFTYYYDTDAAERVAVYAPIKYATSGTYSGRVLESADGTTVYYYNFAPTHKTTINENLTYLWYQDGYYYELELMGSHDMSETSYEELYGDELLAMCHAVYHPFGEGYNLTGEFSEGKVKLSWDELIDDETYTVFYKRSSSDEWKIACYTSKHKVNITGLKSGESYDFQIFGNGFESDVITVIAE